MGVQWLLDGLSYFADTDPEVHEMLGHVRRVAWRTDMRSPFAMIRLRRG